MPARQEKKRKIDYGALSSPFMRISRMDVRAARALLDLNFSEVYQLRGRDPDALFAEYKKLRANADEDIVKFIRRAVEFAESEDSF